MKLETKMVNVNDIHTREGAFIGFEILDVSSTGD